MSSSKRIRTRAIAIALGLALLSAGCGQDRSRGDSELDAATRMAAAQQGIEWLVSHADEMPAGWAHPFLLRLHRMAPDEVTAARIEAVLRDDSAFSRRTVLPANLENPQLLEPSRLMAILTELRRRKAVGEPYLRQVEVLHTTIVSNEARFWIK